MIEVREKEDGYHWEFRTDTAYVQSSRGYKEAGQAVRLGRAWLSALKRAQQFTQDQRTDHRGNTMNEAPGVHWQEWGG